MPAHVGESTDTVEATLQPQARTIVTGGAAGLWNLGRLQRGHGDPTLRRHGQVWWRASSTPDGPVLLRLAASGATEGPGAGGDDVEARAWGPGSGWALRQLPRLLGCHDDADAFTTDHPVIGPLLRRHRLPLGATDLVAESLAPSVIEQRVTGREAFDSIRMLVRRFGTPAPGPAQLDEHPARGMVCPPTGAQWAAIASWDFLQAGVEHTRARTLVGALRRTDSLQRILVESADEPTTTRGERLERALVSLPGIGPWTASQVRQGALGDPDAWSIDDYHVPGIIARGLGGPDAAAHSAQALLELLRPHRYRVELLLERSGVGLAERRGPRRSLPTHLPVSRWQAR